MASEDDSSEDLAGASHEPRECMPCRGSGRVISNLGGTPRNVTCPWCGGAGVRAPGTDAQARWPREDAPADPAGGDPAEVDGGGGGDAPAPAA